MINKRYICTTTATCIGWILLDFTKQDLMYNRITSHAKYKGTNTEEHNAGAVGSA